MRKYSVSLKSNSFSNYSVVASSFERRENALNVSVSNKPYYRQYSALRNLCWVAILLILESTVDSVFANVPRTKIGAPLKLNHDLLSDTVFSDYRVCADGKWVVYRVDERINPVSGGPASALYKVSIEGGQRRRIDHARSTPSFPTGINRFEISPDSSTVVYESVDGVGGGDGIYAVPIKGGASIKLFNKPSEFSVYFHSSSFTEDSSHIVFTTTNHDTSLNRAYSTALIGGKAKLLTGSLDVIQSRIVDQQFIFQTYASNFAGFSIYSSSITLGGSPNRLYAPESLSNEIYDMEIHPNQSHILLIGSPTLEDRMTRYYSLPIRGGQPLEIASFSDRSSFFATFSKSTDQAYFWVKSNTNVSEIHSVSMSNGARTELTSFFGLSLHRSPELSEDGSYLVMTLTTNLGSTEIHSVSTTSGAVTKLSNNFDNPSYSAIDSIITPDSKEVIYKLVGNRGQGKGEFVQLFRASINGAGPTFFGSFMENGTSGGEVTASVIMSLDGSRIVYCADAEKDNVYELYHLIIDDDRGVPTKLTYESVVRPRPFCGHQINATTTHVIYMASRKATPNKFELFSQRISSNNVAPIVPIINYLLDDE